MTEQQQEIEEQQYETAHLMETQGLIEAARGESDTIPKWMAREVLLTRSQPVVWSLTGQPDDGHPPF